MASRYCHACSIHYPSDSDFMECPIHETATKWVGTLPADDNWAALMMAQVETEHPGLADAHVEERPEIVPLKLDVEIKQRGPYLTIHGWDVTRKGITRRLEPLDLIEVGGRVYEIQGYFEPDRIYVIRRFSFELSTEDLGRLASE